MVDTFSAHGPDGREILFEMLRQAMLDEGDLSPDTMIMISPHRKSSLALLKKLTGDMVAHAGKTRLMKWTATRTALGRMTFSDGKKPAEGTYGMQGGTDDQGGGSKRTEKEQNERKAKEDGMTSYNKRNLMFGDSEQNG